MVSPPETLVCSCWDCVGCCSCCLHGWLGTLSSTCCLTVLHLLYLRAAVRAAMLPRGGRNKSLLSCPADTTLLGLVLLGETVESILCLGETEIVFVCQRHLTLQCLNIFLSFERSCFPPIPHSFGRDSLWIFLKKYIKTKTYSQNSGWYKL